MVGLFYWFPKFTGRMLNERWGKIGFWLMFVGFNVGFFTMHISGLLGMPRRVYTYPAGLGLSTPNLITTIGSYAFATGVLLFVANVLYSRKRGAIAGPNPWDAPTLEWSVPSPTPVYNFAVLPSVASRHPLWEERLDEGDGKSVLDRGLPLDAHHETLGTSAMDGEPDIILKMPSDSYAPFLMTLCISAFFSGLLIHWWWLVALAVLTGVSVGIVWLWPRVVEGGDRALPA
jgi:cytochrome c/quinol oxidase subunit I